MDIKKIEVLLLRLISKEFPFVKGVKFNYGSPSVSRKIPFIGVYVDVKELCDTYDLKPRINVGEREEYNFLSDMVRTPKDIARYRMFETISYSLDELAFNLSSPFVEMYCESKGIRTTDDFIVQYYKI